MMSHVPRTIQAWLQRNELGINDVDWLVLHQASRFLLETLVSQLEIDPQKVPILLENTGNTVSSTVPMVLGNLLRSESCSGKKVLVSGFGVGLSWVSNIIDFGDQS